MFCFPYFLNSLKLKWPPRCSQPRETLIVPRRPLEKASLSGWLHFQYITKSKLEKILFIGQSKYYTRLKG